MIMRHSSGRLVKRRLRITAFKQTDFPYRFDLQSRDAAFPRDRKRAAAPRCLRRAMRGNRDFVDLRSGGEHQFLETDDGAMLRLGDFDPDRVLAGIGAMIRTLGTFKLSARSSPNTVTLLTRSPDSRRHFVLRYHRTSVDADDLDIEIQVGERLLTSACLVAQVRVMLFVRKRIGIL